MILISDSGSTKSTWIAIDHDKVFRHTTAGINALQMDEQQISNILHDIPQWGRIDEVWFYGAGCGKSFPQSRQRIFPLLTQRFDTTNCHTESDLTAAARALFADDEGIACILGTGSNSCVTRQGEVVQNTPPLGFILGDEGSGADLGRHLINGIYKGFIPLKDELETTIGLRYEQILQRIYRHEGANRFLASFAPFIHTHLDCPEVAEMVSERFRQFARRNLAFYPHDLEVGFVGSIAYYFGDLLRQTLLEEGFGVTRIEQTPDSGLINYHQHDEKRTK